jgi:sugar lactone lactonase YvrE
MGPTLWSSDLTVFAEQNPNMLGSHLDMLHMSPLCMGISHQVNNVYWTIGGLDNALYRYDFGIDNGIGNDDHSDGVVYRYATGQMKYAPGVPSHLFFHAADEMLYVADTGNARVVKLDTNSGTSGPNLQPLEPMKEAIEIESAVLADVVTAASGLLTAPSGLEIRDGLIYVSDNANGRISAFTLAGERVNYLETGLPAGALSGMAFGSDGKLYLVDMQGNRVLRVDPRQ